MDQEVILYRGDFEPIDEFRVAKTHSFCLLGKGIYLTTKQRVADSYRIKGAMNLYDPRKRHRHKKDTLWSGQCNNRLEAYENAFPHFLTQVHNYQVSDRYLELTGKTNYLYVSKMYKTPRKKRIIPKQTKEESRIFLEAREKFDDMISNGEIVAEYGKNGDHREIAVIHYHGKKIGYVTSFRFKQSELKNHMFVMENISDKGFWELMWENDVRIGLLSENKENYVAKNLGRPMYYVGYGDEIFSKIRKLLEPYGYLGFEYAGGLHIGGYGYHRAFCVWDECWLNQRKIARID